MVERPGQRRTTETLLRQFAVVAILGPRQIGKTTLARRPVAGRSRGVTSFDLEDARDQTLRVLVDEPGVASWPRLVVRGSRRLGFELKRSTMPALTRSMHVAAEDLRLRKVWLVHAGERAFDLSPRTRAVPLSRMLDELQPLG